MSDNEAFAAWIEDDDGLREQIMIKCLNRMSDVTVVFAATVRGFWECLLDREPHVLVIDVILPQTGAVRRLWEGVDLARWIRAGQIPRTIADEIGVPPEKSVLPKGHRCIDAPIAFCSVRNEEKLEEALEEAGLAGCPIYHKGLPGEETAVDRAVRFIRQVWDAEEGD